MTARLCAQPVNPFPQLGILLPQGINDAPEGAMAGQGLAGINHRGRFGAGVNDEGRSRIRIQQHANTEVQDGRAHLRAAAPYTACDILVVGSGRDQSDKALGWRRRVHHQRDAKIQNIWMLVEGPRRSIPGVFSRHPRLSQRQRNNSPDTSRA